MIRPDSSNRLAPEEVNRLAPEEVNRLHANSDKDSSVFAQHHTLGLDANQSSAGNHDHDGRNSKLVLKGKTVGFPSTASATYSQSEMQAVIDALKTLGAGS